jgi:hypothetical protein
MISHQCRAVPHWTDFCINRVRARECGVNGRSRSTRHYAPLMRPEQVGSQAVSDVRTSRGREVCHD